MPAPAHKHQPSPDDPRKSSAELHVVPPDAARDASSDLLEPLPASPPLAAAQPQRELVLVDQLDPSRTVTVCLRGGQLLVDDGTGEPRVVLTLPLGGAPEARADA